MYAPGASWGNIPCQPALQRSAVPCRAVVVIVVLVHLPTGNAVVVAVSSLVIN